MSTIKKVLSAGLLGGLYLFDPASVSAIPSKGSGSRDIQTFPMNGNICPLFPYFDQIPKHDYCPFADSSSDHKVTPVADRNLFEVSYDFSISTTKKSYWFVEARIFNKEELLFQAIKQDNTDKAYYLMKNGADLKAKDKYGRTLLHYVRNKEVAQWLKDNGADVNAKDCDGQTPLFCIRDKEITQCLINNGADVNAKDSRGRTLLEYYLEVVHDKEIAQCLINNGADINAKDSKGRTFLEYFLEAGCVCDKQTAQWLIDNGADINAKDSKGRTFLEFFLEDFYDKQIAQWLIDNGADINAIDSKEGRTFLEYFLEVSYDKKTAKWLIDNGADVNAKNKDGQTLLHIIDNFEKAKWLLDHGADVNARDKYDRIPLHYIKDEKTAQLLIDNGTDVNARDKYGRIPLHHYIKYEKTAQLLIDNGADVNARDKDNRIPLHYTTDEKTAQLHIYNGADVNALDRYNQNPLHLAETEKLAKFLQEKGAKLFRGIGKDRAFVFYPSSDNNGALSRENIRFLTSNLTLEYSVGQRTIEEYGQLIETLDSIPPKSLNLFVIAAHGSPKSIRFGEDSERGVLSLDKFPKEQLRRVFKKSLAPNATVVLNSCSTALGIGSIAYDILQTLPVGTKLIAAEGDIFSSKVRVNSLKPFDISFFGIKKHFDMSDSIKPDEKIEDITLRFKREQTKKQAAKKPLDGSVPVDKHKKT